MVESTPEAADGGRKHLINRILEGPKDECELPVWTNWWEVSIYGPVTDVARR